MKPFVIGLDDRALSLARNGQILTQAPSAVFDGSVGRPIGTNAWNSLRARPMAISTRHLDTILTQRAPSGRAETLSAAELQTRLAEQPLAAGERIWIASPANAEANGLSTLLGIARRLALPLDGFVDSATVTVAALGVERNAIVVELGLHHAAATAVDVESGQARRRRSVVASRAGFIELHQMWLDLVSTTMVKRTRFDPLHDAATEQQLFDALPSLTREAADSGNTTAAVSKGTERFEVALTRDQFTQAADTIFRAMVSLAHQLRPAGAPISIVLAQPLGQLPGLREQFEQFVGCELILVPDGLAAAAASLLDLPENPAPLESVRLLRRMPLQKPEAFTDVIARELLGRRRSSGAPPSHVLLDGRAYSLSAEALVVGRTPDKPEMPAGAAPGTADTVLGSYRSIRLPDGLAGVSRRHCTFVHDGETLVLLDHSTFGTFVNGERVQERVRVHAGDRIRLGEPGVELSLIAVGDVTAAVPQS